MKRTRRQNGGVFLDRRVNTWYFRKTVDGKRQLTRIGTLSEYPTKSAAVRASMALVADTEVKQPGITFEVIAQRYMEERMPTRHGGYSNWLEKYAIPKWGGLSLDQINPGEVEVWLKSLARAPKSRAHIKAAMRLVYEFAMLVGIYPIVRNPMELVRVKDASKRRKKKRVLTHEEWARFIAQITSDPQRTAIITCLCLGLRREELWALKWSDFNFVKATVRIQRTMVDKVVYDTVKTEASEAELPLSEGLVKLLLTWRGQSQFNKDSDWVWASPFSGGERPLNLNGMQHDHIVPAAKKVGLESFGWHAFRHTYRAWLNDNGTPLGVQKDLMRHANISTTANVYGAAMEPSMREANDKLVRMVIQ
jgi:integrase